MVRLTISYNRKILQKKKYSMSTQETKLALLSQQHKIPLNIYQPQDHSLKKEEDFSSQDLQLW